MGGRRRADVDAGRRNVRGVCRRAKLDLPWSVTVRHSWLNFDAGTVNHRRTEMQKRIPSGRTKSPSSSSPSIVIGDEAPAVDPK